MSFQNVSSPRIYVSVLQWLNALGQLTDEGGDGAVVSDKNRLDIVDIAASGQMEWYATSPNNRWIAKWGCKAGGFDKIMPNDKNFAMVLGHNLTESNGVDKYIISKEYDTDNNLALFTGINYGSHKSEFNGWSLSRANNAHNCDSSTMGIFIEEQTDGSSSNLRKIRSYLYGTYYDMNAPNLSLTMSRDYGSTKEFTTYNGSSISNTMGNSPPKWGELGAWELDDGTSTVQGLSRSGRRTWQLKFSFMDDSDLWGSNQMLGLDRLDTSDSTDSGDVSVDGSYFNENLLTDDNFFSQVWHKTLGLTLPCVLQPDNTNFNPDQFAIVRGVSNSLKATQTAFNVYDISLSIEEVW